MTVRSPHDHSARHSDSAGLRRASTGDFQQQPPGVGPAEDELIMHGGSGQASRNLEAMDGTDGDVGKVSMAERPGDRDPLEETARLRTLAARMTIEDSGSSATYPGNPSHNRNHPHGPPTTSHSFPDPGSAHRSTEQHVQSPAELAAGQGVDPLDYNFPSVTSTHSDSPDYSTQLGTDSGAPPPQHQQRQPHPGMYRADSFLSSGSTSMYGGDFPVPRGLPQQQRQHQQQGMQFLQHFPGGMGHATDMSASYRSSSPASPSMSMMSNPQGYYPGAWLSSSEDEFQRGISTMARGYIQPVQPSSSRYGAPQAQPFSQGYWGRGRGRGQARGGFGLGQYAVQGHMNSPYNGGGPHYQPGPHQQMPQYAPAYRPHRGSPDFPYPPGPSQSAYSSPQDRYSPTIMPYGHGSHPGQTAWSSPHQMSVGLASDGGSFDPTGSGFGPPSRRLWNPAGSSYNLGPFSDDSAPDRKFGFQSTRGIGRADDVQGDLSNYRATGSSPARHDESGRQRATPTPGRPRGGGRASLRGTPTQASMGLGIAGDPALDSADPQERERARAVLERKEYHPAPPINRSDWVMWVGNVPGNASHEEMWKFFTAPMHPADVPFEHAPRSWVGVSSIFLISRSSCAFVNLKSEEDLTIAIAYFNGRTIRPWDPRCPPLVCRIRKTDDDLRAGVGGQRGAGLHTRYVKELKEKEQEREKDTEQGLKVVLAQRPAERSSVATDVPETDVKTVESASTQAGGGSLPTSPSCQKAPPEGEGRRRESVMDLPGGITPAAFAAWAHDRSMSGNHSFASTNSSLLARHFPKRYFIMKSLNQEDLERSVKTGYWATQAHNEPILDQAYRTSPEVILIFGANKQGGFFGYALMRSAIKADTKQPRSVSQSSNVVPNSVGGSASGSGSSEGQLSRHSGHRAVMSTPSQPDIAEEDSPPTEWAVRPPFVHAVSDEMRLADASPREMTPGEEEKYPPPVYHKSVTVFPAGKGMSAPQPYVAREGSTPGYRPQTLDPKDLARIRQKIGVLEAQEAAVEQFSLDPEAPIKAVKTKQVTSGKGGSDDKDVATNKPGADGVVRKDMVSEADLVRPEDAPQVPVVRTGEALEASGKSAMGTPFKIEWIKVGNLPFHQIKHLRNPWNQDKEVKISRDGTEISPDVAPALLAEWDKLPEAVAPVANAASARRASRGPYDLSHLASAVGA